MNRLLLAFFVSAAAVAGAVPASNESEISVLYARGLAGDAAAVDQCIAALEQKLALQPNDQVARVYLGSAFTLRSRDLVFGPAKLSALRQGLALMDEAAAAAPQNANVQLTRAITTQALPAFLGRRGAARQQLDKLVAQVEKEPEKLSPHDRQLLYLNAGAAAQSAGDETRARTLWDRGQAIAADPKLTAEIRAALARAK